MLNPIQRAAISHLVAYNLSPPDGRMEHKDFCEMVGITPRSFQLWRSFTLTCPECGYSRDCMQHELSCRKCGAQVTDTPRFPEFYTAWKKAEESAAMAGDDLFAVKSRQWALEQLVAMYSKAKTVNDKRQVLKDILAQTADVADNGTAVDFSELTDEELKAEAMNRNISVEAEVLAAVKGV